VYIHPGVHIYPHTYLFCFTQYTRKYTPQTTHTLAELAEHAAEHAEHGFLCQKGDRQTDRQLLLWATTTFCRWFSKPNPSSMMMG
jgi:hypothetical protein